MTKFAGWTEVNLGTLKKGDTFVYVPLGSGKPERMDTWRVDHQEGAWATVQMLDAEGNVRLTAVGKPGATTVLVRETA